MAYSLILALVIAVVTAVFAVQNAVPVTVVFLKWRFNGSLALILLLAVAAGALLGLLVLVPNLVRKSWTITSLKRQMTGQPLPPEEEPPA